MVNVSPRTRSRNFSKAGLYQLWTGVAIQGSSAASGEQNASVRSLARKTLRTRVRPEAQPMLWLTKQRLKSRDIATRLAAVAKLAVAGDAEALDGLLIASTNPDESVRSSAIKALGQFKDERVLATLLRSLCDPGTDARAAAAGALMQCGDSRALPQLVLALNDPSRTVAWHAARTLEALGWQPSSDVEAIRFLVASGRYSQAIIYGANAVEPLVSALKAEPQGAARRSIIEALGRMGDIRVVKTLIFALKDNDPLVRVAAIEALNEIQDSRATEALVPVLKDSAHSVRAAAASALGKKGCSLEPLLVILKDTHWEVRLAAVQALGRLKLVEAIEPLTKLLHDPDGDVREGVIKALENIGGPQAIERLIVALIDPQTSVRQTAAGALTQLDAQWEKSEAAKAAIPELRKALSHKEYWVRQSAADVLAKIGSMRQAEPKLNAFSSPEYLRHKSVVKALFHALGDYDRDLRLAAVEALGRIGDAGCIELLVQATKDSDTWVRQAAARSLNMLGWHPEAQPKQSPAQNVTQKDMRKYGAK